MVSSENTKNVPHVKLNNMTDSWTFPQDLLQKIPPQHYLHVLDNCTNVVRVEIGPQTYRCKDQEVSAYGPAKMIIIPPRHYVVVNNPVQTRVVDGKRVVVKDKFGQAQLLHGDQEVRLEQDPFPLYPGEVISDKIKPLDIVEANTTLKLQAIRDFVDRYAKNEKGEPIFRKAGEEWYFEGPATYIPQHEVKIVSTIKAIVLQREHALRLTTQFDFVDRFGIHHAAGSEWHYVQEGAFIPSIHEIVVKTEKPRILTDKTALHLRAEHHFIDSFGIERVPGSEWLVTNQMTTSYIPHVFETVVGNKDIISLGRREWVVVINPVDDHGRPQYGKKLLVKGEKNFFLKPGEELENSPQQVQVLTANQALLVQALKNLKEDSTGKSKNRIAGQKWLVYGPKEYWPPLDVKVLNTVRSVLQIGNLNIFDSEVPVLIIQVVTLLSFFSLLIYIFFY